MNLARFGYRIARRAYYAEQRYVNRRWTEIKREANGMLRPSVYKAIYQTVKRMPDMDFVEVGGAHGASSIALAQGMRDSGKDSRLIVVEKCAGGSRDNYGGYDANYAILTNNLQRFNVDDRIRLYPHGMSDGKAADVLALKETECLAGFMHDADGWLDRDFAAFWPHVVPGGLIIIDDWPLLLGDIEKKRRTWWIANQLRTWGLISLDRRIGDTVFGHKPVGADWSLFDRAKLRSIVERVDQERPLARVEW